MASILRFSRLPVQLRNSTGFCPLTWLQSRNYWNKDWRPGPYPRTPAERAAAAKKYGLRPEDYEPHPDDGYYPYGDYPKITPVSMEQRDPFENWDIPELKRNFGEPMHTIHEMYTEDRYNNKAPRVAYWKMLLVWMATVGFIVGMEFTPIRLVDPVMPKQYPYGNLWLERGGNVAHLPEVKQYTFDPAE